MNEIAFAPELGRAPVLTGLSPNAALPPILVADDDEDDLYFTTRLLKKVGPAYPIVSFRDGLEVVNYLLKTWLNRSLMGAEQPRLLFLDLKMNGLHGFGFLEWIREHRASNALSVVVLSGSDQPQDVERAKRLGANRYLVKHPSLATLTTIVQEAHRPGRLLTDLRPAPFEVLPSRNGSAFGNDRWQYGPVN